MTLRSRRPLGALSGRLRLPGDKSISHRAALLGAIAEGQTRIHGFLEADDTERTIACLQALGVNTFRAADGEISIRGVGLKGLRRADSLQCGNSGTTLRLLLGLLAGCPSAARLDGDASLRRRPMADIAEPLTRMGATVTGSGDRCFPPLVIVGGRLRSIAHESPEASAQVKSAVLLAGLHAEGVTSVTEPFPTRDHTERMLEQFGASVERQGLRAAVRGPARLRGCEVTVPGDISAAAFPLVAAALVPRSALVVESAGLNPTRTGILDVLSEMGAGVVATPDNAAEPAGDITVSHAPLRGISVGGALVPRMIDEIPIFMVAAALAEGETRVTGAARLRVKESDRLRVMTDALNAMGAKVTEQADGFTITGPARLVGARQHCGGDHRVAMALAVAGLVADGETVIEGAECIQTSFPTFPAVMQRLGAPIEWGSD